MGCSRPWLSSQTARAAALTPTATQRAAAPAPRGVYPHARQQAHAAKEFLPRAELVAPRLQELLALYDAGFRAVFSGSPIKRIGRDRFVRNCLYAAGNSGDEALRRPVEALLGDPDPAVADAARWALSRLAVQPV